MSLPNGRPSWFRNPSAAVLAVVLFFLANYASLFLFKNYKQAVNEDFAATELQRQANSPDVALVGSSMILYPMADVDHSAGYRDDSAMGMTHAHYLEHSLGNILGRHVTVNDVAYMGFMVSDDYFIVDNYLKAHALPKSVVILVGPRDFYDSSFLTPAAGIAFQKLAGWQNFGSFCDTYLSGPSDYIDFGVSQALLLYAIRAKFQEKLHDHVFAYTASAERAAFGNAAPTESKLDKSLREYKQRYQGINDDALSKQFWFMRKLLGLCKQRGIKTIVINAPLTSANRALLPPGLYAKYCQRLTHDASENANTYIDLSSSKQFSSGDFSDSVHLNARGGRKLVSIFEPQLVQWLSISH